MNYKNKKILSRLMFLGVIGLFILGLYWMAQSLSRSQDPVSADAMQDFNTLEDGKAVLVEFADFQCPACGMYYPIVKQLKEDFGDNLIVVYKHFPLRNIHRNADLAARASEAAKKQGKFMEMHDMIFENQNEWSDSGKASSFFSNYAVSIGLDAEKFLDDIDASNTYDAVNSDYQEGVRLKVTGTPTFFLNGRRINNPRSYDEFKILIEQEIR